MNHRDRNLQLNTTERQNSTQRPAASTRTQTVIVDRTNTNQEGQRQTPVLRLRRRRIRWTADTHDNEHDGRKSSKSCCIYHKKHAWNESSSESDVEEDEHDHADGNNSDSSSSSGGPIGSRPIRQIPSSECYTTDTSEPEQNQGSSSSANRKQSKA